MIQKNSAYRDFKYVFIRKNFHASCYLVSFSVVPLCMFAGKGRGRG